MSVYRPQLGFACSWWHPRESTWSYIPAGLLGALCEEERIRVTPIDAQRPLAAKAVLKMAHRVSGTPWRQGRLNRALTQLKIRRQARRSGSDAVLALGLAEPGLPVPTYFYQDMGYTVLRSYDDRSGYLSDTLGPVPDSWLALLTAQESARYRDCAGIFTMGAWFARWLADVVGLPSSKVHPVGGGLNAVSPGRRPPTAGFRGRLLFVGGGFFRKGGDIVVDAVTRLRRSGSGDYRLTVVGPKTWPLPGDPPDWVDFRGRLAPADVGQLWAHHDVFVQPSWFEAYGLAFLEARAGGLPCVARRAFAMPELVPDGAGVLVDDDAGAEDVAAAIHSVSTDDAMAQRVALAAGAVARDNSWSAVAGRMLGVIYPELGPPAPRRPAALIDRPLQ